MTLPAHLRKPSALARYCCKTCKTVETRATTEMTNADIATTSLLLEPLLLGVSDVSDELELDIVDVAEWGPAGVLKLPKLSTG